MPPAALPGAKLLKSLTNRFAQLKQGSSRIKGGCDLSRGTRGKTHPLPAFKVAHRIAGVIPGKINPIVRNHSTRSSED